MPSKTPALRIDSQPARPTSGATPATSTADYTPAERGRIEEPENLVLSTGLDRSAVTPTAYIYVAWDIPPGPVPTGYILEIAESNTFPEDGTETRIVRTNYETVRGLKTGTVHYVRVAAQSGSRQSAWAGPANITTAIDTVQPGPPTSVTVAFIGSGDLRVRWTNPTSPNFRHVEIRVYNDSSKSIHYETAYSNRGEWIWTAAQNRDRGSGTPDVSVYVELQGYSWGGLYSASTVSASATKAAPSAPVVSSQSWSGDTGTAGPDWTIVAPFGADVVRGTLTLDGKVIPFSGRHTYALDANRTDHSGSPDPVLSYSIVFYDGLDQASPTISGTATNAVPVAPTSVTISGTVATMAIAIGGTKPADFAAFVVRIIRNGVEIATYRTTNADEIYNAGTPGTYQVGVKVEDVFGQPSSETLSSATALDFLTLSTLRLLAAYSDDLGTSATTLAALKDGTTGAGGITYGP